MDSSENFDFSHKRQKLLSIIARRSLLRGEFRLTSGRSSNFFIDLKKTMLDPEGASLLADLLFEMIRTEDVDCIGGMETGAIPLVAALCLRSWPEKPLKGFFIRKEAKGHGTDQRVDGLLDPGSRSFCSRTSPPPAARPCGPADEARRISMHDIKGHHRRRSPLKGPQRISGSRRNSL